MIQSALSAMGLSGMLSSKWYFDSGASNHMTGTSKSFVSLSPYQGSCQITTADGTNLPISGTGTVLVNNTKLEDVLLVPKLSTNLISIGQIVENNCNVLFTPFGCVIQDQKTGKIIGKGHKSDTQDPSSFSRVVFSASQNSDHWTLWHRRLGHLNSDSLSFMFKQGLVSNKNFSPSVCSACCLGKSKILPFPSRTTKTTNAFNLVHSDVWGASSIVSSTGFRYFVTFIDDYTKFTWIYLLRTKSEVFQVFKYFVNMVENQFECSIKTLRSNSGGEYVSNSFQKFPLDKGIIHEKSCPATPQ
jgi:GAG-pre-integrase domain/Integrase core domain